MFETLTPEALSVCAQAREQSNNQTTAVASAIVRPWFPGPPWWYLV